MCRSPLINARAFRLRISPPSAFASATLSTGRSISVPSSPRPAASSMPRCWRTCSAITRRRSATSRPPNRKCLNRPSPHQPTNARFVSGWTLPPRPKEWGAIDLSAIAATLPPPGVYPGTIAEVRLTDRVDVLWMTVRYRLDGIEAEPAADMAPIAADPGSAHARRVPDGARLLHRLAAATGADLSRGGEPRRHPCPVRGQAGGPQAGAQGQGRRARACRPRDPPAVAARCSRASLRVSARWDGWRQSR